MDFSEGVLFSFLFSCVLLLWLFDCFEKRDFKREKMADGNLTVVYLHFPFLSYCVAFCVSNSAVEISLYVNYHLGFSLL